MTRRSEPISSPARVTLVVFATIAGAWLVLIGGVYAFTLAMPFASTTSIDVVRAVAIGSGGALGVLALLLPLPSRSGSIVRGGSACVNGGVSIVALWFTFAVGSSGSVYSLLVAVPAVLLVTTALLGVAPLRRPPAHLCAACGYDLRGTDWSVCPECGDTPT